MEREQRGTPSFAARRTRWRRERRTKGLEGFWGQDRIFVRKTVMPSASGSTPLRVGGCSGLFRGSVVFMDVSCKIRKFFLFIKALRQALFKVG